MGEIEVIHAEGALREQALEVFVEGRAPREAGPLQRERRLAWRWALDLNPHSSLEAPPRLWLARLEGRPVGVLLGVPFRLHVGQRSLSGHWGVDLYVPPAGRGRGIGAALLTRWRDESPVALGLGITDSAYRIELSLGWRAVELPPRLVVPLSTRGALALRCDPRRISPSRASSWHETRVTDAPDALIEGLYERLGDELPAHVARDAAWLAWRYPAGEGWQWVTIARSGRLEAACVLRIDQTRLRRKAWLYELLVHSGEEATGRALIAAVLEHARRDRVDVIEGRMTAPYLRNWLEKEGFFPGRAVDRFIVHSRSNAAGEELHRVDWHLTLADSGNP